jgi:succinate-acetate transporter protein
LSWALFTAYMTVAALKTTTATLAVFVALTLAFIFLGIGALQNDVVPGTVASMTKVGGYIGILTALLAWYASAALVINSTHKKDVLPTLPR